MTDRTELIKAAKAKYNSYNTSDWVRAGFDEFSGGFCVYHKNHLFAKKGGGGDAEKTVGKMLAKLGKQVEFLSENSYRKSPDIHFDNQTWDIKYINKANAKTIRWDIEQIRKKGADNGIFYWDKDTKLSELNSALYSEKGKLQKMGRIDEMPNLYYMDTTGLLRTLWKK